MMETRLQESKKDLLTLSKEGSTAQIYESLKEIADSCRRQNRQAFKFDETFFDDDLQLLRSQKDAANRARYDHPTNVILRNYAIHKTAIYRTEMHRAKRAHNGKLRNAYTALYEQGGTQTLHHLLNVPNAKNTKLNNLPVAESIQQKCKIREHMSQLFIDPYIDEKTPSHKIGFRNVSPTLEEISAVIKDLEKNAMPGDDRMSPAMWMLIYDQVPQVVWRMITEVWENPSLMPSEWSTYKMTLIPKNIKAEHDPSHIRTIAIGQIVTKVITLLITKRLDLAMRRENIDNDRQFGFTEGRSFADAHFLLGTTIKQQKHEGNKPYLAFIDFQKAFDKVNRYKLINMLYQEGMDLD